MGAGESRSTPEETEGLPRGGPALNFQYIYKLYWPSSTELLSPCPPACPYTSVKYIRSDWGPLNSPPRKECDISNSSWRKYNNYRIVINEAVVYCDISEEYPENFIFLTLYSVISADFVSVETTSWWRPSASFIQLELISTGISSQLSPRSIRALYFWAALSSADGIYREMCQVRDFLILSQD